MRSHAGFGVALTSSPSQGAKRGTPLKVRAERVISEGVGTVEVAGSPPGTDFSSTGGRTERASVARLAAMLRPGVLTGKCTGSLILPGVVGGERSVGQERVIPSSF